MYGVYGVEDVEERIEAKLEVAQCAEVARIEGSIEALIAQRNRATGEARERLNNLIDDAQEEAEGC